MRIFILICCSIVCLTGEHRLLCQRPALQARELTTDAQTDPLGTGAEPSFAWTLASSSTDHTLRQGGYRIVVATSPDRLQQPSAAVWDSGEVKDRTFWRRPYAGPPLQPHTTYFWRVKVWSTDGAEGPWSRVNRFTTALLAESDWSAHWIAAQPDGPPSVQAVENGAPALPVKPPPLPVFRHDILLAKPVASALLYVAGLGQYEVHLNGRNVTDTVLNPAWTDYRKTVSYNTYDVSKLLRPHANAFGILLGNGMYNVEGVKGHYTKFVGSFGQPKCLLQLEVLYQDGTSGRFVSDSSWRTHPGPVLYSSIFGGEEFDARALPRGWDLPGFLPTGWEQAFSVAGPGGKLSPQRSSPLIIAEAYPSVHTTHPRPDAAVYDLGKNMSGWPEIVVRGMAGSKVHLLVGELLAADGTVTQRSTAATPKDPVLFDYVLRGGTAETWHPRFAYHSFRYVQVTTETAGTGPSPQVLHVAGDFVHARAPVNGTFRSSSTLFNDIHQLIDRAVLSNLASVVTDCPSREKLGWLEQTYLNASTLMLNYDVTGIYEKMTRDIAEAQLPNGLVPGIAPEYVAFVDKQGRSTIFRDSPEWGSAVILSPWALYSWTGDDGPLREAYPAMQRYAAYLRTRLVNGLLTHGLGDWYDIGPGEPGPSKLTSRAVTATGTYYEDLRVLARVASLLHDPEHAEEYSRQALGVRDAYNAALFHPATDQYDRGSQTANAIPLALGLVPPEHVQGVLGNLVADIHAHQDHVTAGDVGFHYVVRALTDLGRSDVLAAMLSRTDSPSYGYQLSRGATTLTEAWDTNPKSSQNHFMLGHGEEWFYRGLAGLHVDMSLGADEAVLFKPALVAGIQSAEATYKAPMGRYSIRWTHLAGKAAVTVSIPVGAQAHLRLPAEFTWQAQGSKQASGSAREGTLLLPSGTYVFVGDGLPASAAAAPNPIPLPR